MSYCPVLFVRLAGSYGLARGKYERTSFFFLSLGVGPVLSSRPILHGFRVFRSVSMQEAYFLSFPHVARRYQQSTDPFARLFFCFSLSLSLLLSYSLFLFLSVSFLSVSLSLSLSLSISSPLSLNPLSPVSSPFPSLTHTLSLTHPLSSSPGAGKEKLQTGKLVRAQPLPFPLPPFPPSPLVGIYKVYTTRPDNQLSRLFNHSPSPRRV
ncbi:hypothetical protein GGR50DRAFT_651290 [Xylaria sp. CBS 124048]|nr:hypothetical protein GGR50DRAFT_651290 [Xylaria sp. CBS 124048]